MDDHDDAEVAELTEVTSRLLALLAHTPTSRDEVAVKVAAARAVPLLQECVERMLAADADVRARRLLASVGEP